MATQLGLYNAALREIGDIKLASTSENIEARRVLDAVYSDVLAECLEEGQWNFAMRTVKLVADTDITTNFGYAHVFDKPSDWVRTSGLSADEYNQLPLTRYTDEVGFWAADVDPIYVRYVSSDASFGGNLGNWPASYRRFVELSLADRIVERLTQNASKKEQIKADLKDARRLALNRDAMNEAGPRYRPPGSWTTARSGGWNRRDRTGNSLIG